MTDKEEGLPKVAQQTRSQHIFVIAGMVLVLIGLGSFYFWSHQHSKVKVATEEIYTAPVEAPIVPKETSSTVLTAKEDEHVTPQTQVPTLSLEEQQQQIAFIQEKQQALQQRLQAPLMLVNAQGLSGVNASLKGSNEASSDANTQFMQQVSQQNIQAEAASQVGPLNRIITQGTLISAVIESAIDSDLPGFLRAIVKEPVYSADGSTILIPSGSALFGQYKSGLLQGQSRIFVVWTRVLTPQGVSVQLGSPGTDDLGVAGMSADVIHRHFWQRFGQAALLSLLGAGAANINGDKADSPAADYRTALAESFAQSANQSLQQDSMIAPTLKSYQGKRIKVMVVKDLRFDQVTSSIKPNLNLF